nr:hypothetical protein Iba_chr13dCG4230 [Ipomoea batatas]
MESWSLDGATATEKEMDGERGMRQDVKISDLPTSYAPLGDLKIPLGNLKLRSLERVVHPRRAYKEIGEVCSRSVSFELEWRSFCFREDVDIGVLLQIYEEPDGWTTIEEWAEEKRGYGTVGYGDSSAVANKLPSSTTRNLSSRRRQAAVVNNEKPVALPPSSTNRRHHQHQEARREIA